MSKSLVDTCIYETYCANITNISTDIADISIDIDTDISVSLLNFTDIRYYRYCQYRYHTNINISASLLRTYTGEPITVEGEMITQVKYGSQTKELGLIVVQGDDPSLFERNWLDRFQLDWKTIGLAMLESSETRVNVLLKRYKEVFTKGLVTMKHFQAKLRVHPRTTPVFHRLRPVLFAVKDTIERELQHLEKSGNSRKGDA